MSRIFSLAKTSGLARQAFIGSKLLSKNAGAFNTSPVFSNLMNQVQIRTSTKKAAGSKTSMKDSAGRRLGAKKHEGQLVKTGEIIYRQRGTKVYPGENCDIGRDHTIYAKEPGFVRYYLDPFHPKRKFVGVALRQDLRLPTDHWAPTVRRFGYVEISDPEKAKQEEDHLSRKDWLLKQQVEADIQLREAKRLARKEELSKQFQQLSEKEFNADELNIISGRLLLVEKYTKNGFSQIDAQRNATFNDLYDIKLALKRNEIDQTKYDSLVQQYKTLAEFVDKNIAQDWQFNLIKRLSSDEIAAKKQSIIAELDELTKPENLPLKPDVKLKISGLISDSQVLTKSDVVRLRRKYLKYTAPESVNGPTGLYKRFDYDSNRVITIHRAKDASIGKQN